MILKTTKSRLVTCEFEATEICSRGHEVIRLRMVKSNTRAVHFYQRWGWRVNREFPHEKFGHVMLEMIKLNETGPVFQSDDR